MKAPLLNAYFYCENPSLKETFNQVLKPNWLKFAEHPSKTVDMIFINDCPSFQETLPKVEAFTIRFPSTPLTLVTTRFLDPDYMEKVLNLPLRFFLPHDLSHKEARDFLSLFKKNSPKEINSEEINSEDILPAALLHEYKKSIFTKLSFFYEEKNALGKDNYYNKLKAFSNEAHKIAGSAGSFGYGSLGEISRALDRYLLTVLNQNAFPYDFEVHFDYFLRKMFLAYQKIPVHVG